MCRNRRLYILLGKVEKTYILFLLWKLIKFIKKHHFSKDWSYGSKKVDRRDLKKPIDFTLRFLKKSLFQKWIEKEFDFFFKFRIGIANLKLAPLSVQQISHGDISVYETILEFYVKKASWFETEQKRVNKKLVNWGWGQKVIMKREQQNSYITWKSVNDKFTMKKWQ